jgi:hypothetical protein
MDAEKIRALRLADPFRPFVIVMDDGRRFFVDKAPYIAISPTGNLVLVATGGETVERLNPAKISDAVVIDSVARSGVDPGPAGGR